MSELPLAAIDRIIRKAGDKRVSESAAEELAEILEEKGLEIASEAIEVSEHEGRKTVRDTDIRLASRGRRQPGPGGPPGNDDNEDE